MFPHGTLLNLALLAPKMVALYFPKEKTRQDKIQEEELLPVAWYTLVFHLYEYPALAD